MRANTLRIACIAVTMILIITGSAASTDSYPSAIDGVHFTAVGNRLLPLIHGALPVEYNGVMYVPYSVFDDVSLRTSAFHSKSANTVRIMSGAEELMFYLNAQRTIDHLQREFPHSTAIVINDLPYVPARFVCGFFMLTYSYITETSFSPIVRISASGAIDDDAFISSALIRMQLYMNDFLDASTHYELDAPVTNTEPEPTPSYMPAYSAINVFPIVLWSEYINELLDTFDAIPLTFCFTAEEIRDNGNMVRRIVGAGYPIAVIEPDSDNALAASVYLRETAVILPDYIFTEPIEAMSVDDAYYALESAVLYSNVIITLRADAESIYAVMELIRRLESGMYNIMPISALGIIT